MDCDDNTESAANAWNQSNLDNLNNTAFDNCGAVIITSDFTLANLAGCGETGEVLVTYTIADECDNSFTKTATLTIIDDTAPELANIPADITAECDEVPAEPTDITATDACDNNVTVDFDEARTDGICQDAYTLVRTWTATDECGNSTQAQQVITIQDSTDPVLANVPADITAECDDIPAEATDVTATDNCDDNVEIEFVEERTNGDCEDSYTLTRTYTATDNCGNTTQAVQLLP